MLCSSQSDEVVVLWLLRAAWKTVSLQGSAPAPSLSLLQLGLLLGCHMFPLIPQTLYVGTGCVISASARQEVLKRLYFLNFFIILD